MLLYHLLEILWWLQPAASGAGGGGGAGAAGGGTPAGPAGGCAGSMGLLAVMMLIFYFLLIRPQQKQQKEHDQMLKSLRKGAMVRTRGGMRGEVTDLNNREVTVLIADKVKVNVLRSHIAGVETGEEEASGKGDKKE